MADFDISQIAAQYPILAQHLGVQPISDGPEEPVPAWKAGVRQMLEGAAHPQTAGDIASLLLPAGAAEAVAPIRRLVSGAKTLDTGANLVRKAAPVGFRAPEELPHPRYGNGGVMPEGMVPTEGVPPHIPTSVRDARISGLEPHATLPSPLRPHDHIFDRAMRTRYATEGIPQLLPKPSDMMSRDLLIKLMQDKYK